MPRSSRREFIAGLAAAAVAGLPAKALGSQLEPPLYPAIDLSYFDKPISAAASQIAFAYHAITWGGNDRQAIKDISSLGFRGIQLRANVVEDFRARPEALRDLLAEHRLEMVALSSGGPSIAPEKEAEEIALHARHAAFVREAGGKYLQLTDGVSRRHYTPAAGDYKRLGRLLTEIGKRSIDLGVPAAYHNHMDNLGETPDDLERIMDAADPRYVRLLLDVAHYTQGGGDPVKAVKQYRDRLLFLHIKDVEDHPPAGASHSRHSYRFVELGRGRVDLPGVFRALGEIKFRGWAVIELDSVPDNARTPKESATISKKYVEEKLGLRV